MNSLHLLLRSEHLRGVRYAVIYSGRDMFGVVEYIHLKLNRNHRT